MDTNNELLQNIDKLHTTQLGVQRIQKNLSLTTADVVEWCRDKIQSENALITKGGKNWYVVTDGIKITINAHSYTIITAHKEKKTAVLKKLHTEKVNCNKKRKKHIIIAGVPRAGKSTIAQIISKKLGYQHISMDSIIAGIEKVFPETGIDTNADVDTWTNVKYISSKMAPFLRAMMDSGEYDECDYGMVIDMFQILPQDYVNYIDPEVCEIYYFITSEVTPEERFQILKKYDTEKDYTFYKSDEVNFASCGEIVKISKLLKEQCVEYDLPYFETAHNRQQVISTFFNLL